MRVYHTHEVMIEADADDTFPGCLVGESAISTAKLEFLFESASCLPLSLLLGLGVNPVVLGCSSRCWDFSIVP